MDKDVTLRNIMGHVCGLIVSITDTYNSNVIFATEVVIYQWSSLENKSF